MRHSYYRNVCLGGGGHRIDRRTAPPGLPVVRVPHLKQSELVVVPVAAPRLEPKVVLA